ncbi:MAG: PEP-CTERM sorting domain-containing protein [Candidatus Korobacteraceae bacterium]
MSRGRCGITRASRARRKSVGLGLTAVALLALAFSVPAAASNLVVNGSFEVTTNGPNFQFDNNTVATGWTSSGYNFIFAPGAADTVGATGQFGNLQLWGPNNGSNNGLPATSPDGGNFVAADGAFEVAPIQQTINGLTAGNSYTVNFWWAGAQQSGFTGATTEQWQVSLGSQTQSTVVLDNVSHGFTGWMSQSFTYTASSSSEVLSFLAVGTPTGVPPFVLLDGVTLNANSTVPEPGTLALLGSGLLGAAGFVRRYRFKKRD